MLASESNSELFLNPRLPYTDTQALSNFPFKMFGPCCKSYPVQNDLATQKQKKKKKKRGGWMKSPTLKLQTLKRRRRMSLDSR